MNRYVASVMGAAMLVPVALSGTAWAQSSDARLVGSWTGKAGEDVISIVFNADGTTTIGPDKGTYTADFSKSPGTLTVTSPEDGSLKSLIEFVDDNHVRISEPAQDLPASMADASPLVFERTGK